MVRARLELTSPRFDFMRSAVARLRLECLLEEVEDRVFAWFGVDKTLSMPAEGMVAGQTGGDCIERSGRLGS